jgi:hypothetical protein
MCEDHLEMGYLEMCYLNLTLQFEIPFFPVVRFGLVWQVITALEQQTNILTYPQSSKPTGPPLALPHRPVGIFVVRSPGRI